MGAVVNPGLLVVVLLLGLTVGYMVAQSRLRPALRLHEEKLVLKEGSIEELRHELSEDKKTNRKLRYQLAQQDTGNTDQSEFREHSEALAEVEKLTSELAVLRERLAERDEAMRVARVTIQEIRQRIEGSTSIRVGPGDQLDQSEAEFVGDRLASLEDVTGEINLQR